MECLVPTGGSFVRAFDSGVFRSLDNGETIDFYESLPLMPWSSRRNAQGDAFAHPARAECVRQGAAGGAEA